jgi:hypothetical protein
MTGEKLYEILGDISEKHIGEAHMTAAKSKKPAWVKWGAMAACLCLVAFGIILKSPKNFNDMIVEEAANTILTSTYVNIDSYVAVYDEVALGNVSLEKNVGQLYSQTGDVTWYYTSDTDNLKYLIQKTSDGSLSLWTFSAFVVDNGDTYTYGDVLSIIYGVESAEDIASITSSPSIASNTDLGQKIQKEVGTHTYSNQEDIATFYNIVKNVVCFGTDSESLADENRFTYSFSTDSKDKLTSGEITYGTRYLTVTLKNGTTIDSWKYNALSGSIFEYGGIFTQPLAENDVYALNDIFGIK